MGFTTIDYIATSAERSNRLVAAVWSLTSGIPSEYVNKKVEPARGFYGYATVWAGDVVVRTVELQFSKQVIFLWESIEMQISATLYELAYSVALDVQALSQNLTPGLQTGTLNIATPTPYTALSCPYSKVTCKTDDSIVSTVSFQTIPVDLGTNGQIQYVVADLT